jgi:hypothetical protein
MHVPLHIQLDLYDDGGLIQYYQMLVVIPKGTASDTKCLVAREPDGDVHVVKVHEGGFELGVDLRDRFLIAVFRYLFRRMKRNGGTGIDWWATSIESVLVPLLNETDASSIISQMRSFVTAESHLSEHFATRLSRL